MSPEEAWRQLAGALAGRAAPQLLPRRPREDWAAAALVPLIEDETMPVGVRLAAGVVTDRPSEVLALAVASVEERHWRAVALRRAGQFEEARRLFRRLGERPSDPPLFERARGVLSFGEAGFRWAAGALALLMARDSWDPVWFVDACESAERGIVSPETGALLEEIQRAELELLLLAGAAG